FCSRSPVLRDLHSFPTRRSSDLPGSSSGRRQAVELLEVFDVGAQASRERGEVLLEIDEELVALALLREVDVERFLDEELFLEDELEKLDDFLLAEPGRVDELSQAVAGRLDLLGELDLLLALEEGDLGHLAEVHPDRIVELADRSRVVVLVRSGPGVVVIRVVLAHAPAILDLGDVDPLGVETIENRLEVGRILLTGRD